MEVVMDISNRVAVLEWGHMIAEGAPTDIRVNPRVINAYLGEE
jgi:branched-chain amino acid transport system ATP-binding protein